MKKRVILITALITAVFVIAFCLFSTREESAGGKRKDLSSASKLMMHNLKNIPRMFAIKRYAYHEIEKLPKPIIPQLPNSDIMYSWIERICSTSHRRPGTPEGHAAEEWIFARLKEIGLKKVTRDPIEITVWDARNWKLTIEEGGVAKGFPAFYVPRTGFTGPAGVSGEMVYVGEGMPDDFDDIDVKGKIVVIDIIYPILPSGLFTKIGRGGYYLSDPEGRLTLCAKHPLIFVRKNFPRLVPGGKPDSRHAYFNAYKRGAVGAILILKNHPGNTNSHWGPYDRVLKPMPAMWVSERDGERLKEIVARGARATIVLEGIKEPGVTHNVWGILPGMSDEIILISTHHDSPFKGATEDGTGVATVMSQAWAWSRLPKEKRPRTLLFVFDAGHFYEAVGPEYMVKQNNELIKRSLINVNLEHIAAREVIDRDGEFVFTGSLAPTLVYITPNEHLVAAAIRSLMNFKPKQVAAVPFSMTGSVAPGDGGRYFQYGELNVINIISMPYYLLTAEDTLDKVDKKELETFAGIAAEVIGTLMLMKTEDIVFRRE